MGLANRPRFPMLISLKRATNGQIIYAPNTRIGVVFQASVLDEKLQSKKNLAIRTKQQYKGIKGGRVEDLINQLGLTAFQKQLYGTLSGGQKRRVDIARLSYPIPIFVSR